jgi:hypothetical protein
MEFSLDKKKVIYKCLSDSKNEISFPISECLTNTMINDIPKCAEPMFCGPPPNIENALKTITGYHLGAKAIYECFTKNGFKAVYTNKISYCLDTFKWSKVDLVCLNESLFFCSN